MTLQQGIALTTDEQTQLEAYEVVIANGLQTFYEVGTALAEIRDNRLYRTEYKTFEEYCQQRWELGERRAYQFMDAAKAIDNLKVEPMVQLPTSERQARPLTSLPVHEQRAAWQEALNTAPNGKPTAEHVQRIVNTHRAHVGSFDPDEEYSERDEWTSRPIDEETGEYLDTLPPEERVGRQKPKTNYASGETDADPRDRCQTPAYALDPLLPLLDARAVVWEPAAGEGLLVQALYDWGYQRIVTGDILTGQNYFDYQPDHYHIQVTNPPFSLKYKWLERAYHLGKPFALLMPLESLGAQKAQALFREYGVEIVLLDKRVNYKMPRLGWDGNGAQFPSAWFTWKLNIGQQLTFGVVNRDE